MEKDKNLQEQEAPLKNTDKAYVKVGSDGAPHFPEDEQAGKSSAGPHEEQKTTTIENR